MGGRYRTMRRLLAMLATLVLAGGCAATIAEVESQAPLFQVTVQAPWDQVGACLARAYADNYETTYLPVPSQTRAEIAVGLDVTDALTQKKDTLFVLDIRGSGPTVVSYRQQAGPMSPNWARVARANVERCGTV
jgi:hypothetical protein